jgi:hypothetical protein
MVRHECAQPEFSMLAFGMAMSSNFLFAARGALGKNMMSGAPGQKKLSGADVFALNTIFAFLIMTPVAIYMEGSLIQVGVLVALLESFADFADSASSMLLQQSDYDCGGWGSQYLVLGHGNLLWLRI